MNHHEMHTMPPDGNMLTRSETRDRVLIAIPSFRRPEGLRRALDSIAKLETTADIQVLVADNEGDGAGSALVAELRPIYRFPLTVIPVPERGLTHVRNAMIAHARGVVGLDYMAMVDDDERPTEGWIEALIAMQKRTGCDVVGGPTCPVFAIEPATWMRRCHLFTSGDFPDGIIKMTWGTCNVLFHKKVFEISPEPLFDPMFNALGGEDVDAFMRLRSLGCTFAWASSALVWDDVPAGRMTLRWVTQRAFRIGNSNMAAQQRWDPRLRRRVTAVPVVLTRVAVRTIMLIVTAMSANQRPNQYCNWVRSLGNLAFLLGIRHTEYGKNNAKNT